MVVSAAVVGVACSHAEKVLETLKDVIPTAYGIWKDRQKAPEEVKLAVESMERAVEVLAFARCCNISSKQLRVLSSCIDMLASSIQEALDAKEDNEKGRWTTGRGCWAAGTFVEVLQSKEARLREEVKLVLLNKQYKVLEVGSVVKRRSTGEIGRITQVTHDIDEILVPYQVKFGNAAGDWFGLADLALVEEPINAIFSTSSQQTAERVDNIVLTPFSLDEPVKVEYEYLVRGPCGKFLVRAGGFHMASLDMTDNAFNYLLVGLNSKVAAASKDKTLKEALKAASKEGLKYLSCTGFSFTGLMCAGSLAWAGPVVILSGAAAGAIAGVAVIDAIDHTSQQVHSTQQQQASHEQQQVAEDFFSTEFVPAFSDFGVNVTLDSDCNICTTQRLHFHKHG